VLETNYNRRAVAVAESLGVEAIDPLDRLAAHGLCRTWPKSIHYLGRAQFSHLEPGDRHPSCVRVVFEWARALGPIASSTPQRSSRCPVAAMPKRKTATGRTAHRPRVFRPRRPNAGRMLAATVSHACIFHIERHARIAPSGTAA
jgi:hypothetical protein